MAKKAVVKQRLNPNDVKLACQLINEMAINLRPTWDRVILIVHEVTLKTFTRQSLSANEQISEAYQQRVDAYRKFSLGGKLPAEKIEDPDFAHKQLRDEIADLKLTVEIYDEILMRIIANAIKNGISQEQLEAPLEPIEQGRTDLDQLAEKTRAARVKARPRR
jgi:hypothetical protein